MALILSTNPFASHNVFQVWLSVAKKVDEDLRLHGGEGDLDGGPGEVAGMVPDWRPLHLLLGLVHPPGHLLPGVVPGLAADGDVELRGDDEDEVNEGDEAPLSAPHLGSKCWEFYNSMDYLSLKWDQSMKAHLFF